MVSAALVAPLPGAAESDKVVTEVYIYAFDADGLVRDRLYQSVALDLKKVGERLRAGGLKYYATLSLPPGKYAVKSLVRMPETERKGFVRSDIVVAKAEDVAVLPAIFVDEHPSAVLVRGVSHATAADPFDLAGERFIPAAAPRAVSHPSSVSPRPIMNAARAYVVPTQTSADCSLEWSTEPSGRVPLTAPIRPPSKPHTFIR